VAEVVIRHLTKEACFNFRPVNLGFSGTIYMDYTLFNKFWMIECYC
jgi:hypothetical protein